MDDMTKSAKKKNETPKPSRLDKDVAREFGALCNWAYYCWQFHVAASMAGRPDEADLRRTVVGRGLGHLSSMTQEYALLQIIKLHDKATSFGQTNLTLAFVLELCEWTTTVRERLEELRLQMDYLGRDVLSAARNKVICHNDRDTIMSNGVHGAFAEGEDRKYFSALQEFVNIVWREVGGRTPFTFDADGKAEGLAFASMIPPASKLAVATWMPIPRD